MAPRGPGWPRVAAAGGPRCGCVGRRAAAAGGRVPTLAVRGARARAAVWCGVPGLRRMCLCEAGGGGRRALVRTGGPSGGGCWRPSASAGGARGACARPRGAVGRVCAGLAELVGALGCACAWVRPWAACVRGVRMHRRAHTLCRRAHALCARGYAHARRACGRVCRVLVRYVCAQVRPVPLDANKRTMPASRDVKPGCCKNLGRGFPEVLPKTALCAGYLS